MVTNSMSVQPPSLTEVQLPEGRTSAAFTRYTKGLLVKVGFCAYLYLCRVASALTGCLCPDSQCLTLCS